MRTVVAPDGSEHTVRIEWIGNKLRRAPQQLRRRVKRMSRAAEYADGGCAFDVGEFLAGIAIVLALLLLVVVVAPIAWGLVELLLVIVLAALVWAFRVLLRRPWAIVHRGPGDIESQRWRVVGWREAHRVMVESAESIERTGSALPAPPAAGWIS